MNLANDIHYNFLPKLDEFNQNALTYDDDEDDDNYDNDWKPFHISVNKKYLTLFFY